MDHRWPGRPELQPDESFASWLARTAAANGLRPGELYRIVQPGEDRNPRDLDRYADDHLVERLAESTGADKRRLKLATFRRWTGKLFDNDYSAQKLAWLPPAGRVGGKRCHGQQFCPECLASDAAPYLRLTWRLSFITVCPIHKRLLLDRCPHCGESFNVLRQDKRPVVYVHAPPFADLNGFYDAILRSLNAPYRSTARAQAKWDQLLQLLTAVGTRVLILDEVNNFLIGKVDQRGMVLNSLKSLSNELRIPVVAMGTQDAVRVFQTDQQLGNRFEPIGIPRWGMSREYALFVARYVQSLELKQESDFRSKELVGRIHVMSEGLTGETCKLLALAAETAIHSEREIIDMGTLDQVPWVMPSERRRAAR